MNLSVVIPAKNEAQALGNLLIKLKALYPDAEVIVVNDGSEDNTSDICRSHGVVEIRHLYSKGNGSAIKSGARRASGDVIVFMDGDGQHDPDYIKPLLEKIEAGHDLVVGARIKGGQASVYRGVANRFYNWLSSRMVGHKVLDLTSGMRAVRAELFKEIIPLLPNGFSYPTTSTMAFYRQGYSVDFIPIDVKSRLGKSHIRPIKDGIRFFLIIFKIGTLYSPLKIFTPISAGFFLLGLSYYLYTFVHFHRFTNMSAILFISAMLTFLLGFISEQITTLLYKDLGK